MIKYLILIVGININTNYSELSDKTTADKWKLAMSDAGIKVYSRWVEVNNDLKVRQLKGEMDCKSSANQVSEYISNEQHVVKWLNRAIEHKTMEQISKTEWISYTLFNLPWPFDNQDLVAQNTLIIISKGEYIIKVKGIPNHTPEIEGVNRIQNFEGEWKISAIDDKITKVEYTIITKSKPLAPRWVTDPIIQNNFWTTLNNLQKLLN